MCTIIPGAHVLSARRTMPLRLHQKARTSCLHGAQRFPFYADAQRVEVMNVINGETVIQPYNQDLQPLQRIRLELATCFTKHIHTYILGKNDGRVVFVNANTNQRSIQAHDINTPVAQILSLGHNAFVSQGQDNSITFFEMVHAVPVILDRFGSINDTITDAKKIGHGTYVLLVNDELLLYEMNTRKTYELYRAGLAITIKNNTFNSDKKIVCLLNNGQVEHVTLNSTDAGFEFDDMAEIVGDARPNILAGCFWDRDDRRISVLQKESEHEWDKHYLIIMMNHEGRRVDAYEFTSESINDIAMKGRTDGNTFLIKVGMLNNTNILAEYEYKVIDYSSDSGDEFQPALPRAAPPPPRLLPVSSAAGESARKRSASDTSTHSIKAKITRALKDCSKEERQEVLTQLLKDDCVVCRRNFNNTSEEDKDDITAVFSECGHYICEECLDTMKKHPRATLCPTCRKAWSDAEIQLLLI